MPVSDLRQQFKTRLYMLLQNPVGRKPADDKDKQQVFDELTDALSDKVHDLASRRARSTDS